MLKRLSFILLFVLPAGWLLGRAWSRGGGYETSPAEVSRASSTRPRAREDRREWTPDTAGFLASVREDAAAMAAPGYNPLAGVLAEWTDAEIIAALEESLANPALHGIPGEMENASLMLLMEWTRRDVDAASKWFDALESTLLKAQLGEAISTSWPAHRADEGFAFMIRNESILRIGRGADLYAKAMNAAIGRGPAAVTRLLQVAHENKLHSFRVVPEFPAGFDFQAVADGGELEKAMRRNARHPVMVAWEKQDRDAAYQWTLEHLDARHAHDQLLGGWGAFAIPDFTWSAAQFEKMSDAQRAEFMEGAGNFLGPDLLRVPQFSAAVQDPTLRDGLRMQGVQGIFSGRPEIAEQMLDLLGDGERRLEILENLERQPIPGRDANERPSVDEARLRKLMAQWTTDEARIDRIIENLKQ